MPGPGTPPRGSPTAAGQGDAEARALAKAEYDAARKNATIVANANEVADREYDKQSDLGLRSYGSEVRPAQPGRVDGRASAQGV